MKFIFWFSIITLFYLYFGYPVLVYLFSRFYKQPVRRKYIYPGVSILLSVYNEEKNIENKIRSLLSLDYPESKLEILIGSTPVCPRLRREASRQGRQYARRSYLSFPKTGREYFEFFAVLGDCPAGELDLVLLE